VKRFNGGGEGEKFFDRGTVEDIGGEGKKMSEVKGGDEKGEPLGPGEWKSLVVKRGSGLGSSTGCEVRKVIAGGKASPIS